MISIPITLSDISLFPAGNVCHLVPHGPLNGDDTPTECESSSDSNERTSFLREVGGEEESEQQRNEPSVPSKPKGSKKKRVFVMEYSNATLFNEIIISPTMFGSRIPSVPPPHLIPQL